jgi:hypothetical protein
VRNETVAALLVIAILAGAGAGYFIGVNSSQTTTVIREPTSAQIAISSTNTCSGYPPGGNCPGNITETFEVGVNYSGSWKAVWYGYHSVGCPSSPNGYENYTGGEWTGTGIRSFGITLSGPNTNGVTLLVEAQKLDASTSMLLLRIDFWSNETSIPYGTASLCRSYVP